VLLDVAVKVSQIETESPLTLNAPVSLAVRGQQR
jgi:hypothetical protein